MALTYDQTATLMNDVTFMGRVKVAALNYAQTISETGPPLPPSSSLAWAKNVMLNPSQAAVTLTPPVCLDPAIQANGSAATDQEILGAVQAVADKLM